MSKVARTLYRALLKEIRSDEQQILHTHTQNLRFTVAFMITLASKNSNVLFLFAISPMSCFKILPENYDTEPWEHTSQSTSTII